MLKQRESESDLKLEQLAEHLLNHFITQRNIHQMPAWWSHLLEVEASSVSQSLPYILNLDPPC